MSEAVKNWMLKVLTGPHLGAEVLLGDGEYSIGHDELNDIVIQDESLAPRHARLAILNGAVRVTAGDGSIGLNGALIETGDHAAVESGQVLALGTTYIAVGRPDTDWRRIALPKAPEPSADEATGSVTSAPETGEVSEQPSPEVAGGRRESRGHKTQVAVLVLLVAAVSALALWLWPVAEPAPASATGVAELRGRVVSAIDRLGLENLQIEMLSADRLRVTGYCPGESQKEALTEALQGIAGSVELRIWSRERLMAALRDTLDNLGYKTLNPQWRGMGKVLLSGYAGEGAGRERLHATLLNDVPGIRNVEDRSESLADRLAVLRSLIADSGLANQLEVGPEAGVLVVEGLVGRNETGAWDRVLETFRARFDNLPRVVIRPGSARPGVEPPALGSTIVGTLVSEGGSFAVLGDGRHVREGEGISKAYVVKKVEFDRVLLANGEREFFYYIRGVK